MKKITVVGAVASLAFALAPMPSTGAHEAEYPTTVKLHRGKGAFFGKVGSSKPGCRPNRMVKVFRYPEDKPRQFIGSDVTDSDGDYRVPQDERRRGFYRAYAKKQFIGGYGHSHKCKRGASDQVHVK
jgi:hypothetical protein